MPGLNQISPNALMRLIGTPDAPKIIDVCIDDDFNEDPRLIPTASRYPFGNVEELAPQLRGQKVVIVCHKGLKLSSGASALLRTHGVVAEYLEGGIVAWREAGLPLVPTTALAGIADGGTLWVTRHRPKIDRIACPWLIRRFIDPEAKFLFVEPSQVELVAERFDAIPFDIEGVHWSHRGKECTFDTMISEFALNTEPLQRLAEVVRAADTDSHDLAPQAAGLLAISVGLSRMYKDDLKQLEAGIALYDALYRWARDGAGEGHDWPGAKPKAKPVA